MRTSAVLAVCVVRLECVESYYAVFSEAFILGAIA